MKINIEKLSALSLAAILLLAGCGSYQGNIQGDVDLTPDPVQTSATTTEVTTPAPLKLGDRVGDCFIAADPDIYPDAVQRHHSQDCVPGYLYFEKKVFGEVTLLLDKKFKQDLPVRQWWQTDSSVYAVTEDNELLKVSKLYGSYDVLYTAQYGEIDSICISVMLENKQGVEELGRLLYITDGDNIVIFETETDEYTIVHCENGLSGYWWVGFQENQANYIPDDVYICDECGYDGNYVIWEDNDGNYFWYHPETGENEPLKLGDNGGLATFFVKAD